MVDMADLFWSGPKDLERWLVPASTLVKNPHNPRRGQVALIKDSLRRFGQVRPILVDDHGTIVAGNHTYMAAVEIGWTHVAAIRNEFASEAEARAYLLADNRIPELGSYDQPQMLALLEELEAVDGWVGTGYDADDLDDLRAAQGLIQMTDAVPFTGDFAVSAEEIAARAERLAAGTAFEQVKLPTTAAQRAAFDKHVRILSKEWGTSGITETVLRAVVEAAAR